MLAIRAVARVIRPGRRALARPRGTGDLLIPLRGMPGSDDPGHMQTLPRLHTKLEQTAALERGWEVENSGVHRKAHRDALSSRAGRRAQLSNVRGAEPQGLGGP